MQDALPWPIDDLEATLPQSACAHHVADFKSHISHNKQIQRQLNQQHRRSPFTQWYGLLVIRFSDGTTMQTNWTKLASPLEKMRRDGTTVAALLQLTPTDDRQKDLVIGGGLIPRVGRQEVYIVVEMTRMMSEQNGRAHYK
jgi:hypothetical protein